MPPKRSGIEHAEAVSQGGAFAEAGQVDAFRMDVIAAARLLDGAEDVVLHLRIGAVVVAPSVGAAAVGSLAERRAARGG